jgi:Na+-transporting methylmalonyl-CoA/oxaloacetate decarboxylase gamma subunit
MKPLFLSILALAVFAAAGCSKSDKETTVKPQSTPDAARLKSDSQRLQQATANAAKEREKAAASQSTPSPTASP